MAGPTAESNPNAFVGRVTLSAYEPYPILTATGLTSMNPQFNPIVHWVQPSPVGVKNIVVMNSLAAGVPTATGQASTGSEAYSYGLTATLYGRQDYAANSSNLIFLTSGSFGLTANLGYSSTSQTFGMSWATDTSGGASTLSTSSADAGWSAFINGARVMNMPFSTVLTAGEYWLAFQASSTSATSNSNVTLLSMSQVYVSGQVGSGVGLLGQTATNSTAIGGNLNGGIFTTTPTSGTTVALSVISYAANRLVWFALSNA